MSLADKLLERNKAFAAKFKGVPKLSEMPKSPDPTVIVCCLDPRSVPEEFFEMHQGAPVFRNAGARAVDTVRSLVYLRQLGNIKNVMLIHHTDCGMTYMTEEAAKAKALEKTPAAASEIENMDMGTYSKDKYNETILGDVKLLQGVEALKGVNVRGFSYDTFTGLVSEVV